MTIENIGIERLPNIYFKKINLEDNDERSFKVVSELLVLDEILEESFIWSIDPLFTGFMKTCVIETSNVELAQQIVDGVQNPHPSLLKSNPLAMENTKVHIFGFGDLNKKEDEDDKYFYLGTSMPKSNDTTDLTLFAFNYIDHKEISNFLQIKLTGPLQQYMGPVVSESIMTNSAIQETSNIFNKPDGDVWSGPVHQGSDGEYYSGASSESETTMKLTRKTIRNTKLTDARSLNLKDRAATDFNNLSIFSELMSSLNSEADLFGVFSINMKQLILMKTESGKHIYGLGDKLFSSFMDSVLLNSLEIRRRQVRFTRQTNKLGTAFFSKEDILPYETIAVTQESSPRSLVENENIKEISLDQDKNIRSIQFADFGKTEDSRGEFIYEVHLTVVDKSQQFLESIIEDMKTIVNQVGAEVRILNKNSNYNSDLGILNINVPPVMTTYIEKYYEYYSILKQMSDDEVTQAVENKKSLFKKGNYKKRFGLNFINDWEKLTDSFQRRFGIFPKGLSSKKSTPSSGYPPNIISIMKTFDNKVLFDSIKNSYDVLGIKNNKSVAMMTKEEFLSRGDQEIDRFYDLSNSQTSDEVLDMDNEDSNAIKDLETSKMGFLAPLSFQTKGVRKNISSLSTVDLDGISTNFVDHLSEKRERKIEKRRPKLKQSKPRRSKSRKNFLKKRRLKRIKFNFKPVVLKINNLELPRFLETSTYLGDGSEFVDVENNLEKNIKANDTKQSETRFAISNEISAKRSKRDFDLREKDNFYERFKSSRRYSPRKLRRLPVGIKSILNSRSKAAKNNIMDSDSDILKAVDTKVVTEMVFHANQKIEALIGYEKAPDGTDLMTKPMWGEITKEMLDSKGAILCKTTYLEMPEMGIVPAPEFKLQVQNEIFIIQGDGKEARQQQETLEETLPEIEDVVFSVSNIVIQPRGVSNA